MSHSPCRDCDYQYKDKKFHEVCKDCPLPAQYEMGLDRSFSSSTPLKVVKAKKPIERKPTTKKKDPMDGFIKYSQKGKRTFNKTPTISSQGDYRMFMSKSARKFTNACNFEGVFLFYDPDKKQIGIQFTNSTDKQRLKLTNRGKKSPAIAIKGFMQFFKLKPFKKLELKKTDIENFYTARLKGE